MFLLFIKSWKLYLKDIYENLREEQDWFIIIPNFLKKFSNHNSDIYVLDVRWAFYSAKGELKILINTNLLKKY